MKQIIIFLFAVSVLLSNELSNYDKGVKYYNSKEYKKAFKYFEKSANSNNSESAYILGYFYTGGVGVKQNLKQALPINHTQEILFILGIWEMEKISSLLLQKTIK